jgi:hypothetical protein
MPTLVSDGIKNGKQKGPGTDASMITAMKRNRAVLNGLTSEKFARDPFQLAVTSTSGDGTTMTYNFAAQNDIPFAVNDGITVTGSAPRLTATTPATTAATIQTTATNTDFTTGRRDIVTISSTTANATLRVGMLLTAGGSGTEFGGLSNAAYYRISEVISSTQIRLVVSNSSGTGTTAFAATSEAAGTIVFNVTTYTGNTSGGSIVTFPYTSPVSDKRAFVVGDTITVASHSNPKYNGTFTVLTSTISGTSGSIKYQTTDVATSGSSSANVVITHVSPAYNGTFAVVSCAADSLTVAGAAILTANSTATISGFRRSRTKPIVDSINSRGYLVSGVLPVLTARGMNLSFFPVS